jgi:uncharacterized glyoxalase superfamily protein PhnB
MAEENHPRQDIDRRRGADGVRRDLANAERKFKALSEGGSVNMPFAKTFWAKGFGMCVDQFGIPWMVNCPIED